MPPFYTFQLVKGDDGSFTIGLQPPISISGMGLRFDVMKRFGATPIVSFYCASGYNGVSGLTVTNGSQGIVNAKQYNQMVSGIDYSNLALALVRTDSGHITTFVEAYETIMP